MRRQQLQQALYQHWQDGDHHQVRWQQGSGRNEARRRQGGDPRFQRDSGTVAVLVHPNGTEEILKDSIPTEDGIRLVVEKLDKNRVESVHIYLPESDVTASDTHTETAAVSSDDSSEQKVSSEHEV